MLLMRLLIEGGFYSKGGFYSRIRYDVFPIKYVKSKMKFQGEQNTFWIGEQLFTATITSEDY